jgi:hypothetical protein
MHYTSEIMNDKFLPQHMDTFSRNERLYNFLLQMGYIAFPIWAEGESGRMEAIRVTTSLGFGDKAAEESAQTRINTMVKRPEISTVIAATKSGSDNVVNFPPIL